MSDIFEEAVNVVEKADYKQLCERCPWNKFCIEPPIMTSDEVKQQLEEEIPPELEGESELSFKILTGMFLIGKDKTCLACPVFIARLREGPRLSQEIKRLMQEWEARAALGEEAGG